MSAEGSVGFFDEQFRGQVARADFALNPFELAVLPFLAGQVLDYGCGLGNLAVAAARQGCSVLALDASEAAVASLGQRAQAEGLAIEAVAADLRSYRISGRYDAVVSIGLLMFLTCADAESALQELKAAVRPGGLAAINVLVEGTTWLDVLALGDHCLLAPDWLDRQFAGWTLLLRETAEYPAPGGTIKRFVTLVARRPV